VCVCVCVCVSVDLKEKKQWGNERISGSYPSNGSNDFLRSAVSFEDSKKNLIPAGWRSYCLSSTKG